MTEEITIAVIAKECLPGKVKTRLTPALSPEQAARIAAASLQDTIDVVACLPVARRILFFDGTPPSTLDHTLFEILAQPEGSLDQRLGFLFDEMSGPSVMIGMDTPQLNPRHLKGPRHRWNDDIDAWFGPADDGGFWALGMSNPDGDLIRGVPMSRRDTGAVQRRRLVSAGLRVRDMAHLRDVDHIEDVEQVAAQVPTSRFARSWREAENELLERSTARRA